MYELTKKLFDLVLREDIDEKVIKSISTLLETSRMLNDDDELKGICVDFTDVKAFQTKSLLSTIITNATEWPSLTVLQIAVAKGQIEIVELLLKAGVNPNYMGPAKCTPLWIAIRNNNREIIELLLNYGVDIESGVVWETSKICTPLMNACYNDLEETVRLLLLNHANPNLVSHVNKESYQQKTLEFVKPISTITPNIAKLLKAGASLIKAVIFSEYGNKEMASAKILQAFKIYPELTIEYLEKVLMAIMAGDSKLVLPSKSEPIKNRFYNPLLLRLFIYEVKKCLEEDDKFFEGELFEKFYNGIIMHLLAYKVDTEAKDYPKLFINQDEKDTLMKFFAKGKHLVNSLTIMDGGKSKNSNLVEENSLKDSASLKVIENFASPIFSNSTVNEDKKEEEVSNSLEASL